MEQLFLKKPEFDKIAGTRQYMGQDSSTWVKEIITTFLNEYPMLQNEPLTVTWEKTKFDKGYAAGKLNIPSAGVIVPIIINEYILMPMDVLTKAGVFLPLNEWTANELFTTSQPFNMIAKKDPNTELTLFTDGGTLQFSPTGGTSPASSGEASSLTRDAVKVGSFIDRVTNVDKKDVETLLNGIDDTIARSFEINGTEDIIQKLATVQFAEVKDEYEALVRDLDLDISYVYEDRHGNTFLKQANSRVDYTWEIPITEDELEDLKFKSSANKNEMFKFSTYEDQEVVKDSPEIGDCGYFKLNNTETPKICLVNITKTAEQLEKYATYKCGNGYIAINENKDYYLNDRTVIKYAQAISLEGSDPQIGDYGIWTINDQATEPFEIESIYKSATPGEYEIVGNRGISKIGYYPIISKEDNLIPLDKKYNTDFKAAFYVPGNAKFIKLNNDLNKSAIFTDAYLNEKLANTENEYGVLKISGFNMTSGKYQLHVVEKTESGEIEKKSEFEYDIPLAADFITYTKNKIDVARSIVKHACGRDNAGLYYFRGPEFNKYASEHDIRNLNKDEAIWALLHCKGSEKDIRKLAELKYKEEFMPEAIITAPVSVKELANTIENAVESFENDYTPLKRNLVKEAAVMQDKGTVDAMLSLGLINKKNLLEYISMIPNYEVVLSELSELLILVRMGLAGINERALVNAIESLSQVVRGLKEVQGVTTLK